MKNKINNISIWFNVIDDSNNILNDLINNLKWNKSMKSRYTVNFGKIYQYSNKEEANDIPLYLEPIKEKVDKLIGYENNNILINYYYESNSKMGFHSDNIEQLCDNTGILILSLGDPRIIRFKNKLENEKIFDITLYDNSLLFMDTKIQNEWLHSILPSNNLNNKRISLTFRKLK